MKYRILYLCLLLLYGLLWAQTTVSFDDPGKWSQGSANLTSYAINHRYTDGLFSATGGEALRQTEAVQDGFPGVFGTYAWRLKDTSSVDWRVTISSGGVSSFSVKVRRWDSSPSPNYNLEYSLDGGSNWQLVAVINNSSLGNNSNWTTFGGEVNSSVNNLLIRFKAMGTTERIMVDDFSWTSYAAPEPVIQVQSSLVPFYTVALTPSPSQGYSVSATHLTENLSISAPQGFELSADTGMNYSASLQLSPSQNGDITSTSILVRLSGASEGIFSGSIVHSSSGAQNISIAVSGEASHPASGYATDLFFSEYVEGSSNQKALEIFNGTGEPIDLGSYSIKKQTNGAGTWGNELLLSGILPDNDVFVIAYTSSTGTVITGDFVDLYTGSGSLNFNGNDALRLYKNGLAIDQIGVENQVSNWGTDITLVRKPEISSPSLNYQITDWITNAIDVHNLGSHNFFNNPPVVTAPTLQTTALQAAPANTSISLSWTPGNGAKRIVLINTQNSFTLPVDGIDPIANPVYAGTGQQVVYNSATQIIEGEPVNSVTVEGLNPNTIYWFRAYEANGSGAQIVFLGSTSSGNPYSVATTNNLYTGYYTSIAGAGASLKSNLHNLLRTTHTTKYSYDALWTQLQYTDEDPANSNNIIQIYTGWSIPKSHYGGGVTEWNREHTWSKSHGDFGETRPAGTDLHHMRPCDSTVNSAKGNKDFDMGGSPYVDGTPYPGYPASTGNYTSSNSWEPRDAEKGDVARMIMYMAIRYEGTDTSFDLELVDYVNSEGGTNAPYYGKLSTLLQWHSADPPDAWEARRNDRIHERQGNRNPFVDHPEYAQLIWTPVPQNPSSVGQNSFVATWSQPISATAYYLQVSADSLFSTFLNGYSDLNVGLTTSRTISGLTPGTRYFWRLRSYFISGYSMFSPLGRVTTSSPEPVVTTATIQLAGTNVILSISPVSGALSYKIYACDEPYGTYTEVTSQGTFSSATTWQIHIADRPRRFYRVMGIR